MKVDEFLKARQERKEEDAKTDFIEEYVQDEELEEEPVVKRKVVGRMPKRNYIPGMGPPREIVHDSAIPMPVTEIYNNPAPMMPFFPQPPFQQKQQMPTEKELKQRVKADVQYQMLLDQEIIRQQRANRPRMSMSQKMLKVANQYAIGDGGGTQVGLKQQLFKKPNVTLPKKEIKLDPLRNLDTVVNRISPKITTKKRKGGKGGTFI